MELLDLSTVVEDALEEGIADRGVQGSINQNKFNSQNSLFCSAEWLVLRVIQTMLSAEIP